MSMYIKCLHVCLFKLLGTGQTTLNVLEYGPAFFHVLRWYVQRNSETEGGKISGAHSANDCGCMISRLNASISPRDR